MQLINTSNLNEARKQIDSLASKKIPVVIVSQDDDFNGKILENKKVNALIINENLNTKDYMKQRNSGLNESYCKLASKNKIKIMIDLEEIIKKNDLEKARSLARAKQNIELCKKNRCDLIFLADKKDKKKELFSFLISLGASTEQAKKAAEESFFN